MLPGGGSQGGCGLPAAQGHRLQAFDDALKYITGHDDVWVTTGREIADYYLANYYDEYVEAIKRFKKKHPPKA